MSYSSVQYNEFYYNNLCHVCKVFNSNLKRCSQCKAIAYCSKEHQKQDWKLHKDLCKAIVLSDNELKDKAINNFDDFKKYSITRSMLWHRELSRKLFEFESQMWMFPRICPVCFSKNVTVNCLDCINVSYCSEEHKNEHKEQHLKFCDSLKLCMDIDLYYFQDKPKPSELNITDFESDVKVLPNNLSDLMVMYEKDHMPVPTESDQLIRFIIKSNFIAPAATMLFGLEKSGLLKDRVLGKPNLVFHIVGAELSEICWNWKLIIELYFHWIKDLQNLDFYLIGPKINYENTIDRFAEQLCDTCKSKEPSAKIIFKQKLYHNIVESLVEPDIVVALNSGIHVFGHNSWHESIDSLTLYPEVPLLLTAYTRDEIQSDLEVVISKSTHNVEVILEPQENPFCNATPIRDWETEDKPYFYVNEYITILKAGKQ